MLNALRDSGKLDNTVVIITAGRGIPLSEEEETFDWSHGHLQVPLVIHWPGTPAQRINALTDHTDLMTTLMPDVPATTGNLKYTAHGFDTELSLMFFDEDILHFRRFAKYVAAFWRMASSSSRSAS